MLQGPASHQGIKEAGPEPGAGPGHWDPWLRQGPSGLRGWELELSCPVAGPAATMPTPPTSQPSFSMRPGVCGGGTHGHSLTEPPSPSGFSQLHLDGCCHQSSESTPSPAAKAHL